jgi:hypothetical protein
MSTKGKTLSLATRQKISIEKQKDRRKIYNSLTEYIFNVVNQVKGFEIPSIVSASLHAGISKKALLAHELTTAENSEVRQLLDFIRDLEEQYLRNNSLKGKISGRMASLFLKSEHGLESKPQNLTQNNTFNVSPEILAEAIELSRKPQPLESD